MEYTIKETEKEQRFDRFCRKYFKPYTEVKLWDIFAYIRKWIIKVNGKKAKENYKLILWDVIYINDKIIDTLSMPKESKVNKLSSRKIRKIILQEDRNYVIFNKPAGLVVHPGNKHRDDVTLNDYLQQWVEINNVDTSETFNPALCFRLDKDTSGIIIWGKTYDSVKHLNELIRERKTKKKYIAIVSGTIKTQSVTVSLLRGFDKRFGKAKMYVDPKWDMTQTDFKLIETTTHPVLGEISFVEATLHSGKMHQIRVHLAHLKAPIIGDLMYWNPVINRLSTKKLWITRQLLHSRQYGFDYKKKKYDITCPLPTIFKELFE